MGAIPFGQDVTMDAQFTFINQDAAADKNYLDMAKCEIKNGVVHNVPNDSSATVPTPKTGQLIYNQAATSLGYWDGSKWVYVGNSSSMINLFENSASIAIAYSDVTKKINAIVLPRSGELNVDVNGLGLADKITAATLGLYKVQLDTKGRVVSYSAITASDLPEHDSAHYDIPVSTFAAATANLNLNSYRIINVGAATADTDAVNLSQLKQYSQSFARTYKSVKAASTANITSLSGTTTIDGIALAAGDRVLLKNQSTASANGIYVISASTWARAEDADEWNELVSRMIIVEQGSTQADTIWVCTADQGGTIGTTANNWTILPTTMYTAGNGITISSNQIGVKMDPNTLKIDGSSNLAVYVKSAGALDVLSGVGVKVDNVTIGINASNQLEAKSDYRAKCYTFTITGDSTNTQFSFNFPDTIQSGKYVAMVRAANTIGAITAGTVVNVGTLVTDTQVFITFKRPVPTGTNYTVSVMAVKA